MAAETAKLFPSVPPDFLNEAVGTITAPAKSPEGPIGGRARRRPGWSIEPDPVGWRRARRSMAGAILSSATPERDDRLFPGDVSQFSEGGLNLAHGAAGVLYALYATGLDRHPAHEEWLVERALHPQPGTRVRLYDGLHGVAYVLDRLGRRAEALRVLELCLDDVGGRWHRLGTDLYGGLSGMALNLAHFGQTTGDPGFWAAAWAAAEGVADRLGDEDAVGTVSGGDHPYAGLTRGASGAALMFLRLHEHRPDSTLLDLARTALGQDLRRCLTRDDGSLEVNEGWRTMPYLADGSAGVGVVLDDYLCHRDDERVRDAASAIRRATEAHFYMEPGLILARARSLPPATGADDRVVARHIRHLGWHAMSYRGGLAFPGEHLMRLSMDLATGTAGVLLALGTALHERPVHLPFLDPPRRTGASGPHELVTTTERR